ncbi:protein mono-ADP-ribosyltransferase TIPARP-like [Tiliqua scincoides]|uniref:protein mono-ADP-ribosyltransferase TIPARP-like n=1 Tax=Tiliqua scincoides TaxID=71010 RepID=UPI00346306B8
MAEKPDCREQSPNSLQDVLLGVPILQPPMAEDTPAYHVHQKDRVLICDHFLLGHCPLQEQCPCHHTPFPYHWQWQRLKDHVWLSFSFSTQHHLERLYCSKRFTQVRLQSRTHLFQVLDLDTMKLSGIPLCRQIRRLSNSSNPALNPYFPVHWKVYKKILGEPDEIDEWEEYCQPVADELAAALEKGKWNHAFYVHDCLYNVDFKCLTQYCLKTGVTIPIKYRPFLYTYDSLAPYLRSIPRPRHTAVIRGEHPLDLYCGPYPAAWVPSPQGDAAFTMTEVAVAEMAYYVVSKRFYATFSVHEVLILAIYRVRNDHLWQAYVRQKEIMSRGRMLKDQRTLERHLFHGTGAAEIKSICTMNFDPHLAGKHAAIYGKGIYFAKNAAFSDCYARPTDDNVCHMFLAKVLTGYSKRGAESLKKVPRRYDSCTDRFHHPSIYVVFRSCQCYPYFVIRYKKVDTPVAIDL